MDEKIIKELALYRFRERENDDMKLEIEQLKIGGQLGAMGYEDRVQTSIKCKNNDYVMNRIETLENKIKFNNLANIRVDNALKAIKDKEMIQIVKMVLIDKISISDTARELFKTRRQVKYAADKALKEIRIS